MTQFGNRPAKGNPSPNVYTVLLFVGILALLIGIGFGFRRLTAPAETGEGYGLSTQEVFLGPEEESSSR